MNKPEPKPGKMIRDRDRGSISSAMRETLAVIMAGGRGSRLGPMTATDSKPAIPFGGRYRIIDFTLSNCVNSGLEKICILTQYRAHSLMRHIELGWSFSRHEFGEFIELLPAQERIESSFWYQGTADAVYQNLDIINEHGPEFVLVLAGDHVYKMDYTVMIAAHLETQADVTVGCVEVPLRDANQFGLMVVDRHNRVIGFEEKPENPTPMPERTDVALGSMGIYLFSREFLARVLKRDAALGASSHDFGKDIIPSIYRTNRVIAYQFDDFPAGEKSYWRDVGTIDAYWEANLELIGVTPPLNLYDRDWPIRTAPDQLPPAKFVFDSDSRRGLAVDSLVCNGCIVSGAQVRHSLLSNDVRVNSYARVTDSVLLPGSSVGRRCRIHKAVIDSDCHIPENTVIGENPEQDGERFFVSERGVTLVCPEMLGQKRKHGL